jgi:hypothetical protein
MLKDYTGELSRILYLLRFNQAKSAFFLVEKLGVVQFLAEIFDWISSCQLRFAA